MVNILDGEGALYKLNDVALLVNAGYPDIRRVINSAQRQVVDGKLKEIMSDIHSSCLKYGADKDYINYVKGANIAGFVKVADAMLAQGVV